VIQASSATRQWERRIETTLDPGRYVPEHACFGYVADLERVSAGVAGLVATDPGLAVSFYETFVAGCTLKADEIDDSSGEFGSFVVGLVRGWVAAGQVAGHRPDLTASRLLTWMDDDPYGFCHRLVQDVAEVLDRPGVAALVAAVQVRLEAAPPAVAVDGPQRAVPYQQRRWADALRALHAADADVDAYVHLAEQVGLTVADCHTIATMLAGLGEAEEALSWVERGLVLDSGTAGGSFARFDLVELKPRLLADLGRAGEALAAVWADFCGHPDRFSFDQLMAFVPDDERVAWQEKAITTALQTAGLRSLVELLVHTQQPERLAHVIAGTQDTELEALTHFVAEAAGTSLESDHPLEAARIWRAQGIRVLAGRKSQHYGAAIDSFARAKRGYARVDRIDDWQAVVVQVQAEHRRKSSFMPRFRSPRPRRRPQAGAVVPGPRQVALDAVRLRLIGGGAVYTGSGGAGVEGRRTPGISPRRAHSAWSSTGKVRAA
jgi:hypothetical protein